MGCGIISKNLSTCPDVMHTTLGELVENFDEWMCGKGTKGFTIGAGNRIYWFITPMPKTGKYRCLGIDHINPDQLGWPVYHYPEKRVVIHY